MSDPVIKCRYGHQGGYMTYRHKRTDDTAHWCIECGTWVEELSPRRAGEWIRVHPATAGQSD